jgi:peptide/nickel transport system substrate-binding protein
MDDSRVRLNRIACLFVVLGMVASVIAGCAPPATPAEETPAGVATTAPAATSAPEPTATPEVARGGRLIYGMAWEPEGGVDPHVTAAWEGMTVARAVCDTLIYPAPDGSLEPGLATSWEVSEDGKTYTFHLRDDVTFHDGTPFNADAVKFSFDRIVDPATESQEAISAIGPYASSEVVDDYTVRVHLSEPYGRFLRSASGATLAIVSPTAVEKWGMDFREHVVGTGPFMIQEWVHADHITLVPNPDYDWAPASMDHQGSAYLEEITIKFIPEDSVRVGTVETGETNMIDQVSALEFDRLVSDPAYVGYNVPQLGAPSMIGLNVTKSPTDDVNVRRAINYAIDKQAIVDTLFAGLYSVSYGPLTDDNLGYNPDVEEMYPYDPDTAVALLEDAGWVDTDGDGIRDKDGVPLRLEAVTFRWQRMNEMFEMVQAQLRSLGIDVAVQVGSFMERWEAANACEHNAVDFGMGGADPDVLSVVFDSGNIGNGWAWTCASDPRIDQLLAEGRETVDPEDRMPVYEELQRMIMDDALVVPIREFASLCVSRAEVKGMKFEYEGYGPLFYDAYIEE